MSKIFAFAGSNSSTSINHQWLKFIKANGLPEMEICNLPKRNIPMYDMDVEKEHGIPEVVIDLFNLIAAAETIVIASSEHNASFTSYMKSTMDWLSRYNRDFVKDKTVFITGTSPGRGGAASSIEASKSLLTRFGANVVATMPLPSWGHAFEDGKLLEENQLALINFLSQIKNS